MAVALTAESEAEAQFGVTADARVVKNSNRRVRLTVPLTSADGRYKTSAVVFLALPAGTPIPGEWKTGKVKIKELK